MAEYLHFSLTGDLSLLPLWELQSPCCSAVDRLLPANLIWTQQMVHRESGTEGSETGERCKRERERETVVTRADSQLSDWKRGLKRQRCWRSICICRDMDWSGVIFYLWCHLDCGFLSAQIVCNKLPEKSCKSGAQGMLKKILVNKYSFSGDGGSDFKMKGDFSCTSGSPCELREQICWAEWEKETWAPKI